MNNFKKSYCYLLSFIFGISLIFVSSTTAFAADSAQFISQTPPPATMQPGQSANVSVTFKNTGTTIWRQSEAYKLGSQNPADNLSWGLKRVKLNVDEVIIIGQSRTFVFTVTAPTVPGIYNFQWQMIKGVSGWFGDKTPNVVVTVSHPPGTALNRIGVRADVNGNGGFYDTVTGTAFVMRGNSYIRTDDTSLAHSTFLPGVYDAARAKAALAKMQADGYNTVRVFLDTVRISGPLTEPGVDPVYIQNMVDFLHRAANHNLYTILASSYWLPNNYNSIVAAVPIPALVDPYNGLFMGQGQINAARQLRIDIIEAMKAIDPGVLSNILAYDTVSEPEFDAFQKPFLLTSGKVNPADGGTYDMSKGSERKRMAKNMATYYANQLVEAVRSSDPQALVTISVFTPYAASPWPNRLPFHAVSLSRSTIDYMDIHVYPAKFDGVYNLADDMISAAVSQLPAAKPLMMGEYGAFKFAYPDLTNAAFGLRDHQRASCAYGFDGWLLWTWDSTEFSDAMWNALDAGGAINGTLAPVLNPTVCSAP